MFLLLATVCYTRLIVAAFLRRCLHSTSFFFFLNLSPVHVLWDAKRSVIISFFSHTLVWKAEYILFWFFCFARNVSSFSFFFFFTRRGKQLSSHPFPGLACFCPSSILHASACHVAWRYVDAVALPCVFFVFFFPVLPCGNSSKSVPIIIT